MVAWRVGHRQPPGRDRCEREGTMDDVLAALNEQDQRLKGLLVRL